jgi:hypothetical protein
MELIRVVDILDQAKDGALCRAKELLRQAEVMHLAVNISTLSEDRIRIKELNQEYRSERKIVVGLSKLKRSAWLCIVNRDGQDMLVTWEDGLKAMDKGLETKAIAVEDHRHYYKVAGVAKVSKHQPTLELVKNLCQAVIDVNIPPPVSP